MLKEGDQFCCIIPEAITILPFESDEDWLWKVVKKEGDTLYIKKVLPNGELDWKEFIVMECMTIPID